MAFGVYIHIPYCLQRCVYCDFATYESSQIMPSSEYVKLVQNEIRVEADLVGPRTLDTVYFGGGTPSLLPPSELGTVLQTLSEYGFKTRSDTEITLEINPATIDEEKLNALLSLGFNRFSVGVQTFNDRLLKLAHRKHTAEQTRETLRLLQKYNVNFSGDILFALPTQTMENLRQDLDEILNFGPKHISPYCLTVPNTNPMAVNRPEDEVQVAMFDLIEKQLSNSGFRQYEISNLAIPGFESRHNQIYWKNGEYWGLGLSSHSYLHQEEWGIRFWNPKSIRDYSSDSSLVNEGFQTLTQLHQNHFEILSRKESQTDFAHTALRTEEGLNLDTFFHRFRENIMDTKKVEIESNLRTGLLVRQGPNLKLTPQGRVLSNRVFEHFVFT